ncbi:MAG: hypothetical protein ABS78_19465 [Phenylobacterium sp. SCN 70-31]|nr:MAG: hypothetical protein ABS78_19465 [Phenylobacterium sp. SCN 70-31]
MAGVAFAMTIIGLPLAWLCFKLAGKAFDPWARRAPQETVQRIIYEHHYYDHRVTQPSGPKGGEPMPEPVPVPVVEAVAEPELELNQPIANDNVVPFRRKIG